MSNLVPMGKDLNKAAVANTIQIKTIDDLQRLGEILSKSGFFEDCKQAAQACVKILAGAELGFPAFSSMCGIHLVKGKPALGANLMAAAVKRSQKYDYRVIEHSDKVCKIAFFQHEKEIGISEFTLADAHKAGTQNLGKFARNMLFARAMSNGCRWFTPDIFLGATVYTPDELGATVDGDGNMVELPDPMKISVSTKPTAPTDEIWRQWNSPSDAILWAEKQLPHLPMDEIQAEFDSLVAIDGKKAPAWVEKVNSMVLEQF